MPTSYAAVEDTTLSVTTPGVLAGATDINGDPLTAALATPPSHGQLVLNPDGSLSYVPVANYFGTDQFTFVAKDGTDNSAPETVTINVAPVNDAPVFAPIASSTINEGVPFELAITAIDPDQPPLNLPIVYSLAAGAPKGASIDPNTGVFNWTPSLVQGPGNYVITVVATENGAGGLSSTQSFSIIVNNLVPHDPTSFYVTSLYENILGRFPDSQGLADWTQALRSGMTGEQVATWMLASPEHLGLEVDQLYTTLLGRTAASWERNGWISVLSAGTTYDQARQVFLTSPEYQALHHSNADFIDSLYQNVLGRGEATWELDGWMQAMQSGMTRPQIVQAFLTSTEEYTQTVQTLYQEDLGRSAEPFAVDYWVTALHTGTRTSENLEAVILGSLEYHDKAIEQLFNA